MEQPKLKYLQDDDGNRTHVILPIEYYESLLELLENYEDKAILAERRNEETVSWEILKINLANRNRE
jgi:hypothetical protein